MVVSLFLDCLMPLSLPLPLAPLPSLPQAIKEEIERVNLEVQQAERDYDLNRWERGQASQR